ncbi:pseudaminic acid synthase [Emticicia sp. 21SJ11W-3]|uniref:pseudaminic acid synthase n=1 Tax=Emticicia sp. 21SJ11W-3 TaxID=2916755 RepID=UPI00209F68DA|nr:pseudaminic acid synthase [Emticicia sp. 21SJ11W-3]UTA68409.1 pseudaminic acid synthase [Emticicia sp. 21SJ11W-3]
MKIANYSIGQNHKPFIIAEMSGNHNQSLERALKIIKTAAECGADAIKLQTYTADTITINQRGGLFDIKDDTSLWKNRNLYELYEEAHTPWEWHEAMYKCAADNNIICFSTPFDDTAVDFLENLGTPAHKIASFENNHFPLLKKVAQTGKPVIMSTGASTLANLDEAVAVLRANGCKDLVLLKCTSNYPASPENSNVRTIPHLRDLFQCEVGLSDHTMGIGVPCAAVTLGATVIEKHFCLSRAEGGVDSAFSLEPDELKSLVIETERAWQSLGVIQYGVQESEKKSLLFKRSIYVVKDIKSGEAFTEENLRVIRPGDGLPPKYYEGLLGKISHTDLKAGTPLQSVES